MNEMNSKPYCNDHAANIGRIERLEEDRRSHEAKLTKITEDLTECVVQIKEASTCLKSFVKDFTRMGADYAELSSRIEKTRNKAEAIEINLQDTLSKFESRMERKIEIFCGVIAAGIGIFEIFMHFGQ